jgi:hypothetical protein
VNLAYTLAERFKAGSLEVFVDGRRLTPLLDFTENPGFMGFTILVSPLNPNRLNKPIRQSEDLRVDYQLDDAGSCITAL